MSKHFQTLFTDAPARKWVSGLGADGGRFAITPTSFLEDDADRRFPAFREAWKQGANLKDLFGTEPFKLHGSVGASGVDNHRPDVAKAEAFLHRAGYYKPLTEDGPSGYHNGELDAAIRTYQKDNQLKVDGLMNPGGPTVTKLASQLLGQPAGPFGDDEPERSPRLTCTRCGAKHGGVFSTSLCFNCVNK